MVYNEAFVGIDVINKGKTPITYWGQKADSGKPYFLPSPEILTPGGVHREAVKLFLHNLRPPPIVWKDFQMSYQVYLKNENGVGFVANSTVSVSKNNDKWYMSAVSPVVRQVN